MFFEFIFRRRAILLDFILFSKMRLRNSKLKKIADNWAESEDEFIENEDDDDEEYVSWITRIRKKNIKTRKKGSKKKKRKPKITRKVAITGPKLKISKKKKMHRWYPTHAKSFSGNDIQFLGDDTLPDAILKLETPYEFFEYFFNDDVTGLIVKQIL